MTVRELFDFVVSDLDSIKSRDGVDPSSSVDTILDAYLDTVEIMLAQRPSTYYDDGLVESNEQVFKNVYIPRTLEEIAQPLMDIENLQDGNGEDVIFILIIAAL